MFNIFKKKTTGIHVSDKVVIDETAKLDAIILACEPDKKTVIIFWFDESLQQATTYWDNKITESISLLTAREAAVTRLDYQSIIFAEHYPLRAKEEELYHTLKLDTVQVYSCLREPLFQQFGGEKIIQLMKQLGMKEDEVIEHSMISKSIQKAQEKIATKLTIEQSARSQKDWLEKNISG